jgi:hypothetical protein
MQSESAAVSHPKKTPDKYKESKTSIATMLASGEISNEVASQLIKNLDIELLNASLI